ncbi:MAG: thioesterase [Robiginitomaculum sp.]|nr:MAG: thioesterase [Robiginitomaculum sp.]
MSSVVVTQDDVKQALAEIPFAKQLGIYPLLMGNELTLVLPYAPHIIGNPMLKALHGGAVGAFLETTAIVQLSLTGGKMPKPIGINIDYLRRGKPQDTFARATVARQGSRVANVRVKAWQENVRNPIAILHGNFLISKDKK